MRAYRICWAILMLCVVTPAFFLASATELMTLHETAIQAIVFLQGWYMPNFLASIFAYPVAILATMLPGSSTLLIFLGEMIWQNLGVILLAAALLNVEPPFYKSQDDMEPENATA